MHPYLPTWMKGAFALRLEGPTVALVRRDFVPAFERLGLLRSAGRDAADGGRRRGEAEDSAPPRDQGSGAGSDGEGIGTGRGAIRVVPAGPLGEAVVRPCRRGGLPGRVFRRRYLLGNRALDELVATEALRWRGVPVPEPLAAVQERRRPGYVALVVTRRLPGALPLSRLLASSDPPAPEALMRAAGRAVRLLHEAGGWHADLNAGNLVADPARPELRVTVLDLDRCRIFPAPLPGPLARRNLSRLRRSLARLRLESGLATWPAFEGGYGAAGRRPGVRR